VVASPRATSTAATTRPSETAGGWNGSPRSIRRMTARYCHPAAAVTATPVSVSATPTAIDAPVWWYARASAAASSRRNSPNRATTNPNPIRAIPVRTQASRVRSAANRTRGSSGRRSAGVSMGTHMSKGVRDGAVASRGPCRGY
jgi:hypothetical protein